MPRLRVLPPLTLAPWTRVPNALLDEILPDLSDTELRVLLAAIRATAGWNRPTARAALSYRTLAARTGRGTEALARALRGLEARGLVHNDGFRRGPKGEGGRAA